MSTLRRWVEEFRHRGRQAAGALRSILYRHCGKFVNELEMAGEKTFRMIEQLLDLLPEMESSHLAMGETNIRQKDELEIIMRRTGTSYVYWYNWKYKRYGHLFQDRYKSEAVETDEYFITVLRYIHQNPVKAGLFKKMSNFYQLQAALSLYIQGTSSAWY